MTVSFIDNPLLIDTPCVLRVETESRRFPSRFLVFHPPMEEPASEKRRVHFGHRMILLLEMKPTLSQEIPGSQNLEEFRDVADIRSDRRVHSSATAGQSVAALPQPSPGPAQIGHAHSRVLSARANATSRRSRRVWRVAARAARAPNEPPAKSIDQWLLERVRNYRS